MEETRKNEMLAVVLFAVGLFIFLSLFTFNKQDLAFYTSAPNPAIRNMTGIIGSYIGGFLIFLSGKASYVIPVLVFVWGISRLLQYKPRKVFFKAFGTFFLLTAVSASLSLMNRSSNALAFDQGGLIGALTAKFLFNYLGLIGAAVFITATIILSVLIATEFLILPVAARIFRFVIAVPAGLKRFFAGRIKMPVFDREKERNRMDETKREIARKLERIKKQVEESRRSALGGKKSPDRAEPAPSSSGPKIVAEKRSRKASRRSPRPVPAASSPAQGNLSYNLPTMDFLKSPSSAGEKEKESDLKVKAALLEKTLLEFGVAAKVVKINRGPVITMFELEPSIGTKVNRITSLSDNISLAMKSANLRIIAPLPGKGTIGIEVPNAKSELVRLRDILETEEYNEEESALKLALGKDITGAPIVIDLAAMPHLLIAGATGSGKTVCINCIISSMLLNSSPDELKMIMVDPKRVELMMFQGIPHLVSPIVTNPKKVAAALAWVIGEMERRYDIFAEKGVRNITSYKEKAGQDWENLPFIVIIIDELADLMVVAQQDIEGSIMRLAQLSRAAGIHMILATQRPSVNVITGVIKANFPARISFKVASKVDSRTVLDTNGAEKLLGRGDMLVMEPGRPDVVRGQCSLVEDGEIKGIVKYIKSQSGPQYIEEVIEKQEKRSAGVDQEKDDLFDEAVNIVLQTKQASVSMIQRRLRVGYTRAARMIDIMEAEGIVGPYNGAKPREILVDSIEDIESS